MRRVEALAVRRRMSRSARMVFGRSAQIAVAGVGQATGEAGLEDTSMTVLDEVENPGPLVAVVVALAAVAAAENGSGQARTVTNCPVEAAMGEVDQEQQIQVP